MSAQPQHPAAALPAYSAPSYPPVMAIPLQVIPAPPTKEAPSINSEPMQRVPDSPTLPLISEVPPVLETIQNESPVPVDSESSVHFILAATMNFLGVIISRLVTKKQGSMTASLAGLSFNFLLASVAMYIVARCNPYYYTGIYLMIACIFLTIAVIMATGAYCASERPGTGKGYASEFVFFLMVGILFFPLSLYGLFHPHRRANLGALLGGSITLSVILQLSLWIGVYYVPWNLICISIVIGLSFFGFLGCVIHKLRKDSLTAGNVFTFVCASFLMGPFAWFAAFMSRNRQAITGSMIGGFFYLMLVSLVTLIPHSAAWIALPIVLLSLFFAAFIWVAIDYRRAARRRQQ